MIAKYYKHTLNFKFEAGTSRGVLNTKDSYFIKLMDETDADFFGIGEAGPLLGLSPDFGIIAEQQLQNIVNQINNQNLSATELAAQINALDAFPSCKFALETALMQVNNKKTNLVFQNDFFRNFQQISINGLIWMGTKEFMQTQIKQKLDEEYSTIKLKIGAINFEEELSLLKAIRNEFDAKTLTLRVDANGAFEYNTVLEKLKRLADLEIHSIEQPIKAGQEEKMAELCGISPIPIALDEELINNYKRKAELLEKIKPQYIILKPSLMGGISGSKEWINQADKLNIGWWLTSALESNIGLNTICQFAADYQNPLPQGLGTGKLFTNNFDSPLEISKGTIYYNHNKAWNLTNFN